ncbi:hypothetical protein [Shewanella algae]|uniref:hypothetical protein n=1 Tax=Shewanella algae TaxID=38313 RepID=UPI00235934FD|nr:hypothetical protein [Shewanella algae]MDC8855804.1 hypothetical protein [Shewanella algae]
MNLIKKGVLATVLTVGFSSIVPAYAATATLTWTGIVPGSSADDRIVITGENGSLSSISGTIIAQEDGTFTSDALVVESHKNTGTSSAPVIGELVDVNWKMTANTIRFDNKEVSNANLEVIVNGQKMSVGDVISAKNTLSTKVTQTAILSAADVAQATVQASVTLLAESI